jgi:hypothetical protein
MLYFMILCCGEIGIRNIFPNFAIFSSSEITCKMSTLIRIRLYSFAFYKGTITPFTLANFLSIKIHNTFFTLSFIFCSVTNNILEMKMDDVCVTLWDMKMCIFAKRYEIIWILKEWVDYVATFLQLFIALHL